MKSTFTKTPSGKYIDVIYNPNIGKLSFILARTSNQFCLSEADADTYIAKAQAVEQLVDQKLKEQNLPYKTELIILTFTGLLESISSGIDVRSKLSNDEIADMLINAYHKRYTEAVEFCNKTIAMFEEAGKNESYPAHYRDYDKHNELVETYMLDLRTFKDKDFKVNLSLIHEKASALLDELIKQNKDNGK